MSVRVMSAVFDRYPEGGGEMLLALALADHCHDDGSRIFPSVETLAKKTRQSARTVQYALRKMQHCGWLMLVKRGRGGRPGLDGICRGYPSEYRINPAWLAGTEIGDLVRPELEPAISTTGENKWVQNLHPLNVDNSEIMGANHGVNGCNPAPKLVQQLLHPNHQLNHQITTIREHDPAAVDNSAQQQSGHAAEKHRALRKKFDVFWSAYPRQINPDDAWDAFCRIKPDDALMEWIVSAIAHQKASNSWQRDGGQYIPYPVNWLKGRRWKGSPGEDRGDQGAQSYRSTAVGFAAPVPKFSSDKTTGSQHLAAMKKTISGS